MKKFSVALCGGVSLLAVASTAFAQQTTNTTTTPNAPPAAAPVATQEVVITGSRIVRNGYSAPTPVTVATTAELTATTPSNIPDGLNKLPVFAGSSTSAGSTNAVGGSGGGVPNIQGGNFMDLRDMGAIRTLILLDGQRVAPTALNGQVDTNTLPEMLVQRVDVVTGGASAVYGSDAVVGVVNFILDKNYTGLKAYGQVGDSTYGDDQSYRFGVAGGTDFAGGRGHVIASYEQYQSDGINSHADRPWAANIPDYTGNGTAANPFKLITNPGLNNATLGGLITSGTNANKQFTNSGLAAFNPGTPTGTSTINTNGQGAYYTGLPLVLPAQTYQGFIRGQYDLTNDVQAYLQLSDTESKVWGATNQNASATPATIYGGNPYLPAGASPASCATSGGIAVPTAACSFNFSRLNRDLASSSDLDQLTDDLSFTAGLNGKAFGDFKWNAYYSHSSAIVRSTITNNINYPNYYAALDAVTGPNGQPACRVNTGAYAGCQPINMFGTGNQSQAALNYIFGNTQWQGVNTLDDFAASLSGTAFNDWAGPVSTAFNVEYRDMSLVQTTNANPLAQDTAQINYTSTNVFGIPFNKPTSYVGLSPEYAVPGATPVSIPSTQWAYSTQGAMSGSESVEEISGETVIPLLKDAPFAKSLDVSGAVRYTNYSVSGSAWTWKGGLNYQPFDDLRIRFTESRDIRAPTLYDLFAPVSITTLGYTDPATGKGGVITQFTGGNSHLVPEVSYTTTEGFVYSPSWLPRFKMSVDYYNINMTNVISSINGGSTAVIAQCEQTGAPALCNSIIRYPASTPGLGGTIEYASNFTANEAKLYTHGLDMEASYNFMAEELVKNAPGRFDLRLLYSYQPVLNSEAYPGAPIVKLAGVAGMSADRVSADINYRVGPVSVAWETRWESSQALNGTPGLYFSGQALPAIFYHDLNLTYRFRTPGEHDGQVYFVVDNLLNQYPRIAPATSFSSIPGFGSPAVTGDDQIGRYFTLGLRVQY